MARMPVTPENWLVDDQEAEPQTLPFRGDDQPELTPLPMPRNAGLFTLSGLANREPQPPHGTSLSLLMEPHEIASVPGLPDHAYGGNAFGDYVDQRVQQNVGGHAAGYAPSLDQVSLAPHDWNPSGLDLSERAGSSADESTGDKLELGSKVSDYFNTGIEFWNGQNKILGLHFGPEGPEMLESYSKPITKVLGSAAEILGTGADIVKGAPIVPTLSGGIIKGGSRLGGATLGAAGGGALGEAAFGPPGGVIGGVFGGLAGGIAPDFMYQNMSRQQIGENAARLYGMGADVDPRTFMP
jgi:hypothetical protein